MRRLALGGVAVLAGAALLGQIGRLGVERPLFLLGYGVATLGYLLALGTLRQRDGSSSERSGPAMPDGAAGGGGARTLWPRVGWILFGVALLSRALVLPMPASDDVHRYLWEGRLQTLGGNPYEVAPVDGASYLPEGAEADPFLPHVNHPELTTIYPPLAELVFRVVAAHGYSLLYWKVWMAALDLLLVALLLAFLRATGRPSREVLAYAWHPLPIVCFAGEGHVDVLLLLATWGMFLLLARGRPGWAGAAWGVAVASKFLPLVYLPLLLRPFGWRGLSAALLVLTAVTVPFVRAGEGIVRVLFLFGREMSHNAPLQSGLAELVGPDAGRLLTAGVFLALGALLVTRCRSDVPRGAFGLTALALALSPTVHPWYLTWLVPFFVLGRSPAWIVWSLTVALGFLAYGFEAETGRFALPGPWLAAEYLPVCLLLVVAGIRASGAVAPDSGPTGRRRHS